MSRISALTILVTAVASVLTAGTAIADGGVRVEREQGGDLSLKTSGSSVRDVLIALSTELGFELRVLGDFPQGTVSSDAQGTVEDILDRVLDGESFIVERSPGAGEDAGRVSRVIVLTGEGGAGYIRPATTRNAASAPVTETGERVSAFFGGDGGDGDTSEQADDFEDE
ncbi:MAG: hypothetical protein P8102_10470 [Gammaproteobacteria bacterium]